MKSIMTWSLAFAALALVSSAVYANPRDAGSKIRGEAYEGTSDAMRLNSYNYRPMPVVVRTPVMTTQPQQAIVQNAAPAQPSANATAAVDNSRTGTRTFSVEPQTTAPATTYRTYAPQRTFNRGFYRADRKIRGDY